MISSMLNCYIDDHYFRVRVYCKFTINEIFDVIKRHYYGPIDRYVCFYEGTILFRNSSLTIPEGTIAILYFINVDKHKIDETLGPDYDRGKFVKTLGSSNGNDKLSISSLLSSIVKIRKEKIMLPPKFRDKKMEFK